MKTSVIIGVAVTLTVAVVGTIVIYFMGPFGGSNQNQNRNTPQVATQQHQQGNDSDDEDEGQQQQPPPLLEQQIPVLHQQQDVVHDGDHAQLGGGPIHAVPIQMSSSYASSSMENNILATPFDHVAFVLIINHERELSFDNWPAAANALKELGTDSRDAHNQFTLRLEFPSQLILKHQHSDEFFKRWLARVGDYIFARRILLVRDIGDVIRNPDLIRVTGENVTERGCVLFDNSSDRWAVQIRGLEDFPEELITVVDAIFLRMFRAPDCLAFADTLQIVKISDRIKVQKSLVSNQAVISDAFMRFITLDEAMSSVNIRTNLGAFLPLVVFEDLPKLLDTELRNLTEVREEFLDGFYHGIVVGSIKDLPANNTTLTMLRDEHYEWMAKSLVSFTERVQLSKIIMRSLFCDRTECRL